MALGAITLVTNAGGRPTAPLYALDITMVGAASYTSGGDSGFAAAVQAAAKTAGLYVGVEQANIMGIVPVDTKGYTLGYNKTDDKLLVYTTAATEASGNLSSVTFRFSVLLQ